MPAHDVRRRAQHAPASRRVAAHDDGLHVRRRRRGDGDGETGDDGRGEHQLRPFLPAVVPQLRLHDVVRRHLRSPEHRRARHGRAQALVQTQHPFPGDHLAADLEHGRRREPLGRRHLDHEQVRGGGDGGGARAGDEAGGDFLPHGELFRAAAGVQRDFQGLVQTETQRAVRRFAQRRGREPAIQASEPFALPDGGGLRQHSERHFASHASQLLLHHRGPRPVHRPLRHHAARAHQSKVQSHLKRRLAVRHLLVVPRRDGLRRLQGRRRFSRHRARLPARRLLVRPNR